MPSAVVTFNGRITLPPNVRKQLGLKTGDTIEFVEAEDGRFSICHGPQPIDSARIKIDDESVKEQTDELVH